MRWLICVCLLGLMACQSYSKIDPDITFCPQQRYIERLESPFPPLTSEELATDWGKETRIGIQLAKECDLYRAITSFKRAQILMPETNRERSLQVIYSIALCYYLGAKYCEVVNVVETSDLCHVGHEFPAFPELMIMMNDSYQQLGQCDKAAWTLKVLEEAAPDRGHKLALGTAIHDADIKCARELAKTECNACYYQNALDSYCGCMKSPCTAQTLSAIIPGAGYLYVGQKQTAVTAFLLNGLFLWGAWRFFDDGYTAAGIVTMSLEAGWYVGGIHGSGLAAREYNQRLYERCGKKMMLDGGLFPILLFQKGF